MIRSREVRQRSLAADSSAQRESGSERLRKLGLADLAQLVLDNAIRHSPAGGEVTLAAVAGSGWLDCRVNDAGPGIAPESRPLVFEPFFTRRRGGTGLGLAIVQKIVVEHGGTVACGERDAGGTTMLVRLSLPPAEGGQTAAAAPSGGEAAHPVA